MRHLAPLGLWTVSLALLAPACSGDAVEMPLDASADGASADASADDASAHDASSLHDALAPGDGGATDALTAGPDAGPAPDAWSCAPTRTCTSEASDCGFIDDGCGTMLPCGTCTAPSVCGAGGIPNVCGACARHTCAELGATCGSIDDGCGRRLTCGTCGLPQACDPASHTCAIPATCTGLCLRQTSCTGPGVTTTVTGRVVAPNGTDPLPNAIVYVPNAPVAAFPSGVSCARCDQEPSGSPLVLTTTTADGTFTLRNMPTGTNVPLVIQLGRWRRQITIPNVAACASTRLSASQTRLPRNHGEGDIPLMAFATGSVDALECVLRKIGLDDVEFTAPTGAGRVHLYEGIRDTDSQYGVAAGGAIAPGSPSESTLWSSAATLDRYDMVFFPCQADQGSAAVRGPTAHQNLLDYVNAGGRVFATHFSYVWLYQSPPFTTTASWNVEQPSPADQTASIDTTFPRGLALAQWLQLIGATTTLGRIPLQVMRHDFDAPIAPSQSWLTIDDTRFPGASVQFTFNTPVGAPPAAQCGRVSFDEYHVENVTNATGIVFPSECAAGSMTPQEKLLEYMFFDLASCIAPDQPSCARRTCDDVGATCGPVGDGCGGLLQCGTCPAGQTCGGAGIPSQCGGACVPRTCAEVGVQCGITGDGCGGQILCGACPVGQTCGGGGPGQCGTAACTPTDCVARGVMCGTTDDGCGHMLSCGTCPMGMICGGDVGASTCETPSCTPRTCADVGADCGPIGDGCGNVIQCGTCSAPQTCGGAGVPSVCGGNGPPPR